MRSWLADFFGGRWSICLDKMDVSFFKSFDVDIKVEVILTVAPLLCHLCSPLTWVLIRGISFERSCGKSTVRCTALTLIFRV